MSKELEIGNFCAEVVDGFRGTYYVKVVANEFTFSIFSPFSGEMYMSFRQAQDLVGFISQCRARGNVRLSSDNHRLSFWGEMGMIASYPNNQEF